MPTKNIYKEYTKNIQENSQKNIQNLYDTNIYARVFAPPTPPQQLV